MMTEDEKQKIEDARSNIMRIMKDYFDDIQIAKSPKEAFVMSATLITSVVVSHAYIIHQCDGPEKFGFMRRFIDDLKYAVNKEFDNIKEFEDRNMH